MSELEEVHPERVKWIELDPVPINAESPVAWDDTKKPYASYRVCLGVCFLGIRGRAEAFTEDLLQQHTPSAVCDGHDIWTFLVSVPVDDITNACHHVQGRLMLGREEHFPRFYHVRAPMAPHRDCEGWITARREVFQEESIFCCGSKTTVDEEEGRFGSLVTDGRGA